ncbi:MAG TPA: hypothetical protein VIG73_05540 [Cerasibacillus sp.]
MIEIFIVIILIVFCFDFARLRQQNNTLIDQNERIIELLEIIEKQNHLK